MEDGMLTLLILAAVTVFLVFKLRNVLGEKTGHEKPPRRVMRPPSGDSAEDAPKSAPAPEDIAPAIPGDPTSEALAKMRAAEPGFSPEEFTQGARAAYEMLVMAFENGDKATLREYLSPDVYQSFAAVIDQRANDGLTVDARFVGLREATITGARFDEDEGVAEIDMHFVGEMITVVRDSEHRVVEGDPNELRRERDDWTFGRKMGASDPNWLLIATGG